MFNEPFLKSKDLEKLVLVETGYLPTPKEKAKKLFDWMQIHITYDHDKLGADKVEERNALEVYEDKKGICGEQSYLYIVLARIAGINAFLVEVEETTTGESEHACAGIQLEKTIYVDTTYHEFDICHKKIKHVDDNEAYRRFQHFKPQEVSFEFALYPAALSLGALLYYVVNP